MFVYFFKIILIQVKMKEIFCLFFFIRFLGCLPRSVSRETLAELVSLTVFFAAVYCVWSTIKIHTMKRIGRNINFPSIFLFYRKGGGNIYD
jgi:hypothetical protein